MMTEHDDRVVTITRELARLRQADTEDAVWRVCQALLSEYNQMTGVERCT